MSSKFKIVPQSPSELISHPNEGSTKSSSKITLNNDPTPQPLNSMFSLDDIWNKPALIGKTTKQLERKQSLLKFNPKKPFFKSPSPDLENDILIGADDQQKQEQLLTKEQRRQTSERLQRSPDKHQDSGLSRILYDISNLNTPDVNTQGKGRVKSHYRDKSSFLATFTTKEENWDQNELQKVPQMQDKTPPKLTGTSQKRRLYRGGSEIAKVSTNIDSRFNLDHNIIKEEENSLVVQTHQPSQCQEFEDKDRGLSKRNYKDYNIQIPIRDSRSSPKENIDELETDRRHINEPVSAIEVVEEGLVLESVRGKNTRKVFCRQILEHEEEKIFEENIAQINQETEIIETSEIKKKNANAFLRKVCAFLLTVIYNSIYGGSMIDNGTSYRGLFIVLYIFLFYLSLENLFTFYRPQVERWKKMENLFNLFDTLAALLFQITVDLHLSQVFPSLLITIAHLPFLIILTLYFIISNAPRSEKDPKCLLRALYALQALFIAIKLTGYLKWPWKTVFMFLWVYLGLSSAYSVLLVLLLGIILFACIFRVKVFTFPNLTDRIIGLIWFSIYHGLSILALGALLGLVELFDLQKSKKILSKVIPLIVYTSGILFLYTILLFMPLRRFIIALERKYNEGLVSPSMFEEGEKKHFLNEGRNQANYFVRLSSSFFVPLHEGFLAKSRDKLQKIHVMQSNSKENEDTKGPNKIEIMKALKKDKELFDKKLENSPLKNDISKKNRDPSPKALKLKVPREENHEIRIKSECVDEENENYYEKAIQSADDILDRGKKDYIIPEKEEEEQLCYVCLENPPNAILMSCGHGGICCECATNSIKKRNSCMECRRPVRAIYKINSYRKGMSIVKGFELSQIVELSSANNEV